MIQQKSLLEKGPDGLVEVAKILNLTNVMIWEYVTDFLKEAKEIEAVHKILARKKEKQSLCVMSF